MLLRSRGCLLYHTVALLIGLLALVVFTLTIGHFLSVDDTLSPADAVVVLGGEESNFFRTQQAIRLFEEGYAPVVVFSGGTLEDAGIACSSAQLSLEAAQQLGLPGEAVMIAPEAQSTYDEAVNLNQLVQQHDWHSLIVVTDLFHTRRAALTFRTLFDQDHPGVTIYLSAPPDPRYDAARWWQTEQGLIAVLTEVLKLGFYWANYGIAPF